jgi:hypothetical protein
MKTNNIRILMSLFLAAVLALPRPAGGAEKSRGKTLVLTMRGGATVQGELLAVKENRLVLFDQDALTGAEIDIGDVSKVRVVRPSRIGSGIGKGFLYGALGGGLIGLMSGDDKTGFLRFSAGEKALGLGLFLGIVGIPIGALAGAASGIDEIIDLDALTEASQPAVLAKLKTYSRTAGEAPAPPKSRLAPEPSEVRVETKETTVPPPTGKMTRFHLSVIPGYFRSPSAGQMGDLMKRIGFDSAYTPYDWLGWGVETRSFPEINKEASIAIMEVRFEYSLSRKLALGVSYGSLGRSGVVGHRTIVYVSGGYTFEDGTYLHAQGKGTGVFLTASYFPLPDAFLNKLSLRLTAGIGFANSRIDYTGSPYAYFDDFNDSSLPSGKMSLSRNGWGGLAAAEWSYFFNPHWSLGLNADFKYVPAAVGGFSIECPYYSYNVYSTGQYESLRVDVPPKTANLGGWGVGLNFGYHF